jgi:hypothetical protein
MLTRLSAVTDRMRHFGTIKDRPLPQIFAGSLMWEGIYSALPGFYYFPDVMFHLSAFLQEDVRDDHPRRTWDSLWSKLNQCSRYGLRLPWGWAGLAGAVNSTILPASRHGGEMTIECFVVVVIGGLGSLGGAILGGLIIGQVISFVSLLASDWSNVAIFLTMLGILLVRTRGLFGEAGRL